MTPGIHDRRVAEILLVEDNPGDIRLTEEALTGSKLRNRLWVASDVDEALAFLTGEGRYTSAPQPDLILLDLNLPGRNGRDVLRAVKGDPRLRHIPVVVLTSSSAEEDVVRAYELHANCYVTKPVSLTSLLSVVHAIDNFWLEIVTLQPAPESGGV